MFEKIPLGAEMRIALKSERTKHVPFAVALGFANYVRSNIDGADVWRLTGFELNITNSLDLADVQMLAQIPPRLP